MLFQLWVGRVGWVLLVLPEFLSFQEVERLEVFGT